MVDRKGRRRLAVLAVLVGVWAVGAVAFVPDAEASWCTAPTAPGNVALDAGATAVAVAHTNFGNPDTYSLYVCNDPVGSARVTLTNDDTTRPGHQVTVQHCPLFLGCTTVTKTGVEVGLPTTTVDPPIFDVNGRVGASVTTGPVCIWMGGLQNCQLGGGTYGVSQPVPMPIPNQGDVDAVLYAADTPNRCLGYIAWAGVDFGLFFCTWDAQGVPLNVLWALTT